MKLSLYTYLFERDNKYYLYNSQTSFLSAIDKDFYELLYNHDFEKLEDDVLSVLKEKGIIIDDSHYYDYYYTSRQGFISSIGNLETLELVVAPTTSCNFACPYCFEGEKRNKFMTQEVVEDLVDFVNSYKNTKKLNITWYGGEPLVAFGIMKDIVSKIRSECHITIGEQSIISNGYLINDQVIGFMKENQFKSIQITLDGNEEHHNLTRCLKESQKPTFKTIISNIDRLVQEMPDDFNISIRVNINKENERDFIDIFKMLTEMFPERKISIYPGFIREDGNNYKMCYNSLFGKARYEFYKNVEKAGIHIDYYPKRQQKGCMTSQEGSFVIGPEGELYKCWNDFNHPERIVGYIKERKMINPQLISKYSLESTIYSDPNCKECKLFPVCDGGCGWFRYQNAFDGKKYDVCTFLSNDAHLEECLLKDLPKPEEVALKAY